MNNTHKLLHHTLTTNFLVSLFVCAFRSIKYSCASPAFRWQSSFYCILCGWMLVELLLPYKQTFFYQIFSSCFWNKLHVFPNTKCFLLAFGRSLLTFLLCMEVGDIEVIGFLLQTVIIPPCLRTMEMDIVLSKTVCSLPSQSPFKYYHVLSFMFSLVKVKLLLIFKN